MTTPPIIIPAYHHRRISRQCVICSATFFATTPNDKSCSDRCRHQLRRDQTRAYKARLKRAKL